MAFDVFSMDFFKQIAMSKSDLNKDGIINETEYDQDGHKINEKSIFDAEYKKFDMDKDGDVDNDDVELFKKSVGATPEDEAREAELKEFKEQHPNFDVKTATQEEIAEFKRLCPKSSLDQRSAKIDFLNDVRSSAIYMLEMLKKSGEDTVELWQGTYDKYKASIYEILGIKQ